MTCYRPLGAEWRLACTAPGAATRPDELSDTLDWIGAPVPGTAAQALRAAGRWIEAEPAPLHEKDIWYRTNFPGSGRRVLRFNGLATLAEVWLNGRSILVSDNMFLAEEIEVDLEGENELFVAFRSLDAELARRKGRARWRTALVANNALRHVRTTLLGHMTGWLPPIHAVGPWRSIDILEPAGPLQLRAAEVRATLDGADGVVEVTLEVVNRSGTPLVHLEVGGRNEPLRWTGEDRLEGRLRLRDVRKWWPHTHGEPFLYPARVLVGEIEIDLGRIGFRSIEIDRGSDGRGFGFRINGQSVFARGACWSAADLVTLAADRAVLLPWLQQARDSHMNMIRVAGTMTYESDDFFALCDELGILVWHDFMFASMDYPIGDPAFRASVAREAQQFLSRARSHPSLALLCGGSEIAQQAAMLGLPPTLWSSPLYDEILPGIANSLCPDVSYLAQSPEGGDLPFRTDAGVSHYYGVGAYRRPLEDARRAGVRFASECLALANTGAGPPQASEMIPHDRGADWDFVAVRDHYLGQLYGVDAARVRAEDSAHYLRLARAVSGEVMEAVVAEWRRPASPCEGALVWMLKDLGPGPGWGVIDWRGVPKLAWHALRRAFRPIQVVLSDEGLNGLGVHVINDTAAPLRARLLLICLQAGDVVTMRRECEVELLAHGARTLSTAEIIGSFFDVTYAYRFGAPALDVAAVTLSDSVTGARLAEAAHYPLGRAGLAHDPGLSATLQQDETGWSVMVQATRFAPCIQVEAPGHRGAEEGFFLLPGERRRVVLVPTGEREGRPAGQIVSVAPQRDRTASVRFG